MDRVNGITSECFNALAQLRDLEGAMVSPDAVYQRLRSFIDRMREKAREEGLSERDANDMAYAVVALADEIALGKPEPLRGYWMSRPLQLALFNENVAGEAFFQRLQALRTDGRRGEVLRVYYLCLLLGFQGKYAMRGGDLELLKLIDALKPEIERGVDTPESLSPSGEPPDEPMTKTSERNLLLYIALGVFAIGIGVFVSLRLTLDRKVQAVADKVEELAK